MKRFSILAFFLAGCCWPADVDRRHRSDHVLFDVVPIMLDDAKRGQDSRAARGKIQK